MKQFTRHRTLKELAEICKRRKWPLETKQFKQGSDHVSFKFRIETLGRPVAGVALFNTFNGRIFGTLSTGEDFSSDNANHEHCLWFQILLDTAYTSEKAKGTV